MYVDKTIFSQLKKFKIDFFNGLPQDMNFSEIYKQLKTSEETELYKILNRDINIEDF